MSQNINDTQKSGARGAGTGATDAGTTRDTPSTSMTTSGSGAAATAAQTSQGIAAQAQQYGQKVADAAVQAKDYVADNVSVVGDKFKDLQNKDINQVAEEAKQYARQNPGQAILISAAAGLILGLLLRGTRR